MPPAPASARRSGWSNPLLQALLVGVLGATIGWYVDAADLLHR
ncbi:MAG: hypothetical protein Fur005_49610 [Roseiflexaceae bacterium]